GHCRDGRDVQRDAPCFLADHRLRDWIALPRGGEDCPRAVRRSQRGLLPTFPSQLGGDRGQGARAGVEIQMTGPRVIELARCAVVPAVNLSPQDDAGAEPGADRDEDEVVHSAGYSLPVLADGREVDVVLERHRTRQLLGCLTAEIPSLEPWDVRRE